MENITKICSKCGVEKLLSDYYNQKNGKFGKISKCKECMRQESTNYRKNYPKRKRECDKQWAKNHPEVYHALVRRGNLKRKFGISVSDYESILKSQNDVCAICQEINKCGDRLSVDHDHETNQIRGLLCHNCNNGLGRFKDNKDLLCIAANYLELHKQANIKVA